MNASYHTGSKLCYPPIWGAWVNSPVPMGARKKRNRPTKWSGGCYFALLYSAL